MEPVSLPPLLRVRWPSGRPLAGLDALDVLLVETLPAEGEERALPSARCVGLLSVEPGCAAIPVAGSGVVLGPAIRLGSERALLIELAARSGAPPDAVRWLQIASPTETGEVLASPALARELEAMGGEITGGPSPPVLGPRGELLTRV